MQNKIKTGVLLSGCGVYDGSEIQEAVLTMLMIEKSGGEVICIAPDIKQHHVINHITGEEMNESRNVLVESARIARGKILNIKHVNADELDALVMPGGFGAAKNLSGWAFDGPDATVNEDVKRLLKEMVQEKKPIAALCVSPVVLAKALEDSGVNPVLTLGTPNEPSPYDINGFHGGIAKVGAKSTERSYHEVAIDRENRIISSPCYMMEIGIPQLYQGIELAIEELFKMVREKELVS